MSTSAFTTIPSFEMILPGKNPIALFGKVKISFFYRNDFAHTQMWIFNFYFFAKIKGSLLIKHNEASLSLPFIGIYPTYDDAIQLWATPWG
jgi:hypothetical protein